MTKEIDYIIPDEDSVFTLLPDNRQLTFPDLGGLRRYIQDEIAAWTNIENSIADKYKQVAVKIDKVTTSAKDGRIEKGALSDVKKLLAEWEVTNQGINSCVSSNSRLGKYINELRHKFSNNDVFRTWCLATIIVLDIPHNNIHYTLQSIWPAARAALRFAIPDDLAEKIENYRANVADLNAAAENRDKVHSDRIAQFDKDADAFMSLRNAELAREKEEHTKLLAEATNKVKALEEAYSKKLQLEGPAKYWKEMASSNFCKGVIYGGLALLATSGLAIMVYTLLVNADVLPFFNISIEAMNLGTIRASLMLLVFTSAWAYIIHVLMRLAISSLHLSRDYSERFQLTLVYLALLKEGAMKMDQSLASIVIQAIFCRSDTGLLKGESGIKMPVIGELINKESA